MGALGNKYKIRTPHTELNLTPMVDMFTIILVFLVMSISSSNVQVAAIDSLVLPPSSSSIEPGEAMKVVVTNKGIYVGEDKVLDLNNGTLAQLDAKDPNFIRPLYEELDKHAKKAEEIQKVNPELKFTGQYILQADQNLSYAILKKVIYTSMLAGYADLRVGAAGK